MRMACELETLNTRVQRREFAWNNKLNYLQYVAHTNVTPNKGISLVHVCFSCDDDYDDEMVGFIISNISLPAADMYIFVLCFYFVY